MEGAILFIQPIHTIDVHKHIACVIKDVIAKICNGYSKKYMEEHSRIRRKYGNFNGKLHETIIIH